MGPWGPKGQCGAGELELITYPVDIMNQNQRRIVRVFIADPHPDVPQERALLYQDEERLTDLSDQELFFEVPIQKLLADHNEFRTSVLDKDATRRSGRDVKLEPIRIRDLKMTVLSIATF
jgi:hypothetical protein